jgi:hypothetical protein
VDSGRPDGRTYSTDCFGKGTPLAVSPAARVSVSLAQHFLWPNFCVCAWQLLGKFKKEERELKQAIQTATKEELHRGKAQSFNSDGASAGQMLDVRKRRPSWVCIDGEPCGSCSCASIMYGRMHAASRRFAVQEAARIQGQDIAAAKRMQRNLAATEEVAQETMVTLRDQTEQIGKIHQDLEEIDDTLKMATNELRRYVRRLATDKLIVGFTALIVLGILTIIILNATGVIDDEDVNAPDILPDVETRR